MNVVIGTLEVIATVVGLVIVLGLLALLFELKDSIESNANDVQKHRAAVAQLKRNMGKRA